MIPFAIDNAGHRMADVLNGLLAPMKGRPLDVATAYFAISGYRLVRATLHGVGNFRLLNGSDPQAAGDVGLKPSQTLLARRLSGDVEAEAFTEETRRLSDRATSPGRGWVATGN